MVVRIPGPSTMLSETIPLKSSIAVHTVLHTVTLLSPLGIVPLVHGANQITGNAADSLKANTLAQLFVCALDSHIWFLLWNGIKIGFLQFYDTEIRYHIL